MKPLNPVLYNRLIQKFQFVRVVDDGRSMMGDYLPNLGFGYRKLQLVIRDWGETYKVNCPDCNDTKFRLCINHRWAVRDERNRDDNLHLVKCFNEDCFNTRQKQKELHATVFPLGSWANRVQPLQRPTPSYAIPDVPIVLPRGTLLTDLSPEHRARLYLRGRGFDPDLLSRDYQVQFSEPTDESRPRLYEGRIVVPIFALRRILKPVGSGNSTEEWLAGWQARSIDDEQLHESSPKYMTATGTKKTALLYGLPQAVKTTGPAVIVEGITDAWRVGPRAVAMLGKNISTEQCKLAVRRFRGRTIVVWLDADASEDAKQTQDRLRESRFEVGDGARVLLATTPEGRGDPGDCQPEEIRMVIERAIGKAVTMKAPAPQVLRPRVQRR